MSGLAAPGPEAQPPGAPVRTVHADSPVRPERGSRRRVPDRLDVRPLDSVRSFKVKLGVLVALVVTLAALLTQVSIRAGIEPLLALPLVVLIALVFTQVLARGMTSPLREMTRAAQAMARGDYTQSVRTTSRDEVGQLASAFSAMAAELEQTDRMRRDLVANVSHELRTPVAGLRAQLENLVDGVTEPDLAALSVALSETERLSLLVDHLLDLSRLDAGVIDLDLEEIELTPFLHEVVDSAALASGGRDVRWTVEVEPPDLRVLADAARVHQVIHNLLENAARHSPAGGRIRVGAARTAADDGVLIDVHDEGPGIAREDRDRVFERFQRGGRSDSSGGTGLGLAIARWAVGLHGGTIEVLDDPRSEAAEDGRSSLIRVVLPDDPT
ncbi:sensor histidine kinase [Brachybacterium sp. J153]|uniref:sensor histidine kinase n=1 Tax=Brachybacterium sp. J153 TaxID=3116488 RepID=UPI002E77D227|nr:ATP-binding protein [Brachybacterium sp. J153]MEE1617065.1 ATP-binding protein [Brachybacterium sp. J153]